MLTINLSDGVVAGLRLCKSSLEESVKLVMNSSTIEVSKIQAVDILEELRYTATPVSYTHLTLPTIYSV